MKLFHKIAVTTLGIVMATAVGAGVAHYNRGDIRAAKAASVLAYTLEPVATTNNAYNNNIDAAISGITWNVTGNSSGTPWKLGGKATKSGDVTTPLETVRSIYSKTAISDNVDKIEIVIGAASSVTVNSINIGIYSTASKAQTGGVGDVANFTPAFKTNDTIVINKADSTSWANCFYNISFDIKVTSTSNKFIEFNRAKFYKTIQDVDITGLAVDDISLMVGKTTTAQVTPLPEGASLPDDLAYAITDTSVATVDENGLVTALKSGSTTITVSSASKSLNKSASVVVSAYEHEGLTVGSKYIYLSHQQMAPEVMLIMN